MRLLFLITCFFLWSPAAYACLGASLEHSLFFKEVPPALRADLVAEVVIEELMETANPAVARVRVTELIQGRIKPGEEVQLQYELTSCGPYHKAGEKGIIIAMRSGVDNAMFYPLTRRKGDDP